MSLKSEILAYKKERKRLLAVKNKTVNSVKVKKVNQPKNN